VRHHCLALLVVVATTACSKARDANTTDTASRGTAQTSADSAGTASSGAASSSAASSGSTVARAMTDEEVLGMLATLDSVEVGLAKHARTAATSASVRELARTLELDHARDLSAVEGLAKTAGLTPRTTAADSTPLAIVNIRRIEALKGADLDTAFVNAQVAQHQAVISQIEAMQRTTQREPVKAFLAKELTPLHRHLDRAKAISDSLSKR
jgi:putative membrane protein